MIPVIVIGIYLLIVIYISIFAFRQSKSNSEDFFLASRTIGAMVFFLSLFATNMTAFAILGSSGQAYRQGIGIYGLMASSSGFMIPLTIFFIGTRLWALGKRFGHMTQVQFFRDRWECSEIGTVIFALSAAMLIPYMIISIMGGGTVLEDISRSDAGVPLIPYWGGCLVVALVVTVNVFFGGMRGTVWVNIFQTILFLLFGLVAVAVISHSLPGGFSDYLGKIDASDKHFLLTREKMPKEFFWSYTLVPLSAMMFPHMSIMCLSAQKVTAFKRTVILYPVAIMAIWLPCVFLGVIGAQVIPGLADPDGVLLRLLNDHAPAWLAGLLGAGIISAVMGSDAHQVLALSTMFTKDIFQHYGGKEKYGEKGAVHFARGFIIIVTAIAYVVALYLKEKQGIFEIAIRFAFSGFAAMAPIMVAALFWKRSTKWGALASTLYVAACLVLFAVLQDPKSPGKVFLQIGEAKPALTAMAEPPKAPSAPDAPKPVADAGAAAEKKAAPSAAKGPPPDSGVIKVLYLNPRGDVAFWNGFMPVVPMVFGSALMMIIFSLLTAPPSKETITKYFPPKEQAVADKAAAVGA